MEDFQGVISTFDKKIPEMLFRYYCKQREVIGYSDGTLDAAERGFHPSGSRIVVEF